MWRSPSFAVLAVSVVAACSSQKKEAVPVADTAAPAPVPPPTATAIAPGHVSVKLICNSNGGVDFSLSPWTVGAEKIGPDGTFTWDNDPSSTVDLDITAGNGTYPFGGQKHTAKPGQPLVVTPNPGTPHKKVFKYTITAVCIDPAGNRNVIIDPDMIIPF